MGWKFTLICLRHTGSPFILKVSGAPDASKVRVSGPGIEHGILATFQSRFIVETRGAGAGQLTVRIRGPKGASAHARAFSAVCCACALRLTTGTPPRMRKMKKRKEGVCGV